MSWFVSDIRTPNSAVSICLYISNIKYISSDLQLGKLKENVLATQAFANLENISKPHIEPISMIRASHRRSEGCGFDSRLGLRNIFWVCESLSS